MVFSGADLSAIFAAADANDQTLTADIWSAHGGEDLATYAQCRRRYKAYKKSADADEADAEEEAEPATPAAGKKRSRTEPPSSARVGASTQQQVRDTPHQADVRRANSARRTAMHAEVHAAATQEAAEARKAGLLSTPGSTLADIAKKYDKQLSPDNPKRITVTALVSWHASNSCSDQTFALKYLLVALLTKGGVSRMKTPVLDHVLDVGSTLQSHISKLKAAGTQSRAARNRL